MDTPYRFQKARDRSRSGQAMIESVLVIILVCFCFLSIFQYANLFAAKAVLTHAAARAARTRAVGFNQWMVEKSARVAAIPACGKRLVPESTGMDPAITKALSQNRVGAIWDLALISSTRAPGTQIEVARLSDYMDSDNNPTAANILDYELWDSLTMNIEEPTDLDGTTPGTLRVTVGQRQPQLLSLKAMVDGNMVNAGDDDKVAIEGFYKIESHYPLYMENANW